MDRLNYQETISSDKTSALFVLLTLVFLVLFFWRLDRAGLSAWTALWGLLAVFFGFYIFNYRSLKIQLADDSIQLRFGLITWTEKLENIEACRLDTTSLWRIGGAGIHFSPIRGRYRAMFNFLEYHRVVLNLRKKRGLVRDLAFSTRHPEEVINLIREFLPDQEI